MTGRSLAVLLTSAGCIAAACDTRDAPLPPPAPGFTVVESSGPKWPEGEGWHLDTAALLLIGRDGRREESRFYQVRNVWTTSDGGIVVINGGGPPAIRMFSDAGDFVNGFGGQGEGPGEFASLLNAWRAGPDTIVAFDTRLLRVTWFTQAGEIVRETSLPGLLADGLVVRDRFDDGSWLLVANIPADESRDDGVVTLRVVARAAADASRTDTIAAFEEGTRVRYGREFELPAFMPGVGTYAAIGDRLYAGYPDEFQIDVLTTDGKPIHRIRRTGAQQRLSEAVFERLAEAQIENAPEQSRPAARRQILDKPRPEVLPAFTRNILEDAEGNLWVQNFSSPGARMTGWSVFDSGGAYLGDVPVPAAFTPYEIASGKMLGIWKDSLDVETIRAYRLIKGLNAAPDATSE